MRTPVTRLAALLAIVAATASPLEAQRVGVGVDYLGYQFGSGLNMDAAQLFMVPVAARVPINDAVGVEVFSAWAEGRVEQNNQILKLSGPVDTGIKGSWQATPWAMVSLGMNLPTGNSTHDGEEAVVAAALSTDLLGFREATWGTGFALTSSVAAARRMGGFGVGVAAAYSARGSYDPSEDVQVTYQPGNETRLRLGLDRNFGNSTFTAGVTMVNYAEDKVSDDIGDNRNLFQAGRRLRFDASYAFRAGAGVWTIYGADLMRNNGDLRVAVGDDTGAPTGADPVVVTAKQNLIIAGVMGTVSLGGGFVFRPHVDYKLQTREEADGNDAGSGWLLAAGGDIPIRIFGGYEFFPKARLYFGTIKDALGGSVSVQGLEFKGQFRFNF